MAAKVEVDQNILIKFAQKLAGNEKKYRDRAVKKLRKWLEVRSSSEKVCFTRDDFLKIWKGLHYCMWMSDKPLIQEELADTIASLIHNLKTVKQAFLFIEVHFETECREWFNIDRLRLDKFMMMIRRFFRQSLTLVKMHKWKKSLIRQLVAVLQKTVISAKNDAVPDGIRYHIADIYLDELNKVASSELSSDRVMMFLEPYCQLLTKLKIPGLLQHVQKRIFEELLKWEVEKLQEEEEDSDEDETTADKDPKPEHLQVNYQALADHLFKLAAKGSCLSRNRKPIYELVTKFRDIAEGILPKQEEEEDDTGRDITPKEIRAAAERLRQFEEKLSKDTRNAKRKRQKKLKQKRQNAAQQGGADGGVGKETGIMNGDVESDTDDDEPTAAAKKPRIDVESANRSTKTKKTKRKPQKKQHQPNKDSSTQDVSSLSSRIVQESTGTSEDRNKSPVPKDSLELLHSDQLSTKAKKKKSVFTEIEFSDTIENIEESQEIQSSGSSIEAESLHIQSKSKKQNKSPKGKKIKNALKNESEIKSKVGPKGKSEDTVNKTSMSELKSDAKLTNGTMQDMNLSMSFEDTSDDSPSPATKKLKKSKSTGSSMISFSKPTKTPPAFVKRALGKLNTPKSEPKKLLTKIMKEVQAPGSAPNSGKKKVIFAMNMNQAQDFKESLMVSPVLPFDPKIKPDQSILKLSPLDLATRSPRMKSPRQKLFKKQQRRASDFF